MQRKTSHGERSKMKGFHAKPELIFFVLVLVAVLLLVFGSGLVSGWLKGIGVGV